MTHVHELGQQLYRYGYSCVCQSTCLCVHAYYLAIHLILSLYRSTSLFVCLAIRLPDSLSLQPSIIISLSLSALLPSFVYLCACLSACSFVAN